MVQCKHGDFELETPCLLCAEAAKTKPLDVDALLDAAPLTSYVVAFFEGDKGHVITTKTISDTSLLAMVMIACTTYGFSRAVILDEKGQKVLHYYEPFRFTASLREFLGPRLAKAPSFLPKHLHRG